MRSRRPQTSLFLLICGITLLIAIFVGEKMGERVLHQGTETAVIVPSIATPLPAPSAEDTGPIHNWKKEQVVTVATDPAFPDPRVTRPPTPMPTPRRTPKPTPTPTPYVPPTFPPTPTELPSGGPTPTPFTTPISISTPPVTQ